MERAQTSRMEIGGWVVGDGPRLEGTSDAKQWPLELTVCDVGNEQSATHVRYSPKISRERDQKRSPSVDLNRPS